MSHKALYFSKIVVKKLRVDFNSNERTLHNNDPTAALVSVLSNTFVHSPTHHQQVQQSIARASIT